jgi:ketosteroid isomerase-like protein
VSTSPQQIFERYIYAGAMSRNADALAELFTPDGVYEAPLMPDGRVFPRRLEGRDAIRAGMAAYYEQSAPAAAPADPGQSRFVLHTTPDPDVFIAEIDAMGMALVQIFRVRDGKIALLRDYFAAESVEVRAL